MFPGNASQATPRAAARSPSSPSGQRPPPPTSGPQSASGPTADPQPASGQRPAVGQRPAARSRPAASGPQSASGQRPAVGQRPAAPAAGHPQGAYTGRFFGKGKKSRRKEAKEEQVVMTVCYH